MLRSGLVGVALVLAIAAAGGLNRAAGAAAAPHITAKPNTAMVNTKITLIGTGFPARTKLGIAECSSTGWIVVQHPCSSTNGISVVTDQRGRFTHQFQVKVCPGVRIRPGRATSVRCYIGNPEPTGVDTMTLVGATPITVTYP